MSRGSACMLPKIGEMRLDEVRPRHLVELFRWVRDKGLAPKTVWNVYSVVKALFRDAVLADILDKSPYILTEQHLGPIVDKDPEWRPTAVFSREELQMLISDPRIPPDRRVVYALEGIGGLRHGEMAGLRWRHYDPTTPMLGRLTIATSYDKGKTKTKRPRLMPVHPTLAAMLDVWKATGWEKMMGRARMPDDLIAPHSEPSNRGPRVTKGGMRSDHDSYKRLLADLGLRHRRGRDLRRTLISLARATFWSCAHTIRATAGTRSTCTRHSPGTRAAQRSSSSSSSNGAASLLACNICCTSQCFRNLPVDAPLCLSAGRPRVLFIEKKWSGNVASA